MLLWSSRSVGTAVAQGDLPATKVAHDPTHCALRSRHGASRLASQARPWAVIVRHAVRTESQSIALDLAPPPLLMQVNLGGLTLAVPGATRFVALAQSAVVHESESR